MKAELIGKPTHIQVYETTEYDKFIFITGNRTISSYHVKELISSIGKKNFLPQEPIVISGEGEIIDGQHRLLAAKALAIPIYYIIREEASLADAITLNTSLRNWNTTDYFHSYVALEKIEYLKLKQFIETYKFSLGMSIILLTQNYVHTNSIYKDFKEGKFKILDYEIACEMATLLSDFKFYSVSWHKREFLQALDIFRTQNNPRLLVKQLEKYQLVITERITKADYLKQFSELMSIKKQSDITNVLTV